MADPRDHGASTHTWYHGSPFQIEVLRAGSTVTPDPDLARIFSHKPTLVSIGDDGRIQHDGQQPGYLYVIAEKVLPEDLAPHPRSTMAPGKEWLTARPLRLSLLGRTAVRSAELLSGEQVRELRRKASRQRTE